MKIRITSITLLIVIFFMISTEMYASATDTLDLKQLNISFPIPNKYKVIPANEWKEQLKLGQQFIMSNPFGYDYLIQKNIETKSEPFGTSFFLVKVKRTRTITDKEFQNYINKYYLNWDEAFKEKQDKGIISNLVRSKIIQKPIVDYEHKTVSFKATLELGEMRETQYMYTSFYENGTLVVIFNPQTEKDEKDFDKFISKVPVEINFK